MFVWITSNKKPPLLRADVAARELVFLPQSRELVSDGAFAHVQQACDHADLRASPVERYQSSRALLRPDARWARERSIAAEPLDVLEDRVLGGPEVLRYLCGGDVVQCHLNNRFHVDLVATVGGVWPRPGSNAPLLAVSDQGDTNRAGGRSDRLRDLHDGLAIAVQADDRFAALCHSDLRGL
mgnify:FL=1